MSDLDRAINEEDLHAYVDGRLDDLRRAQVTQHLAANPALQARVRDWQAQSAALRQALRPDDTRAGEIILARLATRHASAPRRGWSAKTWAGRTAMAASLAFAVLLGGAGGWMVHGSRSPTEIGRLEMEATSAYRVFANDPARAIEVSSDNRAELVSWMTQKLGHRVAVPDLSASGYHLMGGRMLSAMYGPAAMLVYQDASDNRITVYVQPMSVGIPAPMRQIEARSVDGYAWIEHQVGYTVLSEGDRDRLHSLANQVRADTRL